MTISALDVASGLLTGLRGYYEDLIAAPDAVEMRPAYLGARLPSDVYIEPDVLRRQRVVDFREHSSLDDTSHERRRPCPNEASVEALDIEEAALYGERFQEIERRESWTQVYARLSRGGMRTAVILGPPGQGKTQLIAMAVRRIAIEEDERIRKQNCGLSALRLPIRMSCKQLANGTEASEAAIAQAVQVNLDSQCSPVVRNYIVSQLQQERAWIFLDALDEIAEEDRQRFRARLATLASWSCRIILTSRPYGYSAQTVPLTQITELHLAPLSARQTEEFTEEWYPAAQQRTRMHELVRQSRSVQALSQNPFLLTLLCAIAEDESIEDSITRTELYEKAIRRLMGGQERLRVWQRLLEEIAWTAFRKNPAANRIADDRLMDLLTDSDFAPPPLVENDGYPSRGVDLTVLSKMQQAELLRRELVQRRVLIPCKSEGAHVFPHRSILECLAAGTLRRQFARKSTAEWIRRKAWDPIWAQVLMFLSGKLADEPKAAKDFIRLVLDEPDDDFLHRHALAAELLAELPIAIRDQFKDEIDTVTEKLFDVYSRALMKVYGPFSHYKSPWKAAGELNGRVQGTPLISALLVGLQFSNEYVRRAAADALGRLGEPAARHPDVITALLNVALHDPDVQWTAADALGVLGESAARRPDVITALLVALRGSDHSNRSAAARALGGMGESAARHPDLLPAILDVYPSARETLAEALGRLGEPAARHPDVITTLLSTHHDPELNGRWFAAKALGELGETTARHPDVLPALLAALDDSDRFVRKAASKALGELGESAAHHPEVLPGLLLTALRGSDWEVRGVAAQAVGVLRESAARHADVLPEMLVALHDSAPFVREAAAQAVGVLRESAARHPGVISALLSALRDSIPSVREAATGALGALGESTFCHPDVLPALLAALRDSFPSMRRAAAEALGELGESTARHSDVLPALLVALRDSFPSVRGAAVRALGKLGESHSDVLPTLLSSLGDSVPFVRRAAAEALGELGKPIDRHREILPALLAALHDSDLDVRWASARAADQLQMKGVRIFQGSRKRRQRVCSVAELVS